MDTSPWAWPGENLSFGPQNRLDHYDDFPPILSILQKGLATVECEHSDVVEAQTIKPYLCDMHNSMHVTQSLHPQNAVPAKGYL